MTQQLVLHLITSKAARIVTVQQLTFRSSVISDVKHACHDKHYMALKAVLYSPKALYCLQGATCMWCGDGNNDMVGLAATDVAHSAVL